MATTPTINSTYTEGDTLPIYYATRTDDITGWTITFKMRRADGTLLSKTAAIDDGPGGLWSVTFVADDLIAGKRQPVEVTFDTGSGVFTEDDLLFDIRESV